MNFLQKILTRDPSSPNKANAYKNGMHYYNQADYETAIIFFNHVLGKGNKTRSLEQNLAKFYCERAYANIGLLHFINHKNKHALTYFKKAAALNPNDADLNYFIGICLNNVGKYDQAMDHFSKIPYHETLDIPNKLKLSIIFHNLGMWETAETIQQAIITTHSGFADAHFYLGLTQLSQGRVDRAVDAFKTAVGINPEYTAARLKLSIAQISIGAFDAAIKNLNIIIEGNPKYSDAYYLLGLIRDRQGEVREALRMMNRALKISPAFKNALIKRIIFYCRLRDQEAAEKAYMEAEKLYPEDKRLTTLKDHLYLFQPAVLEKERSQSIDAVIKDEYSLKALKHEFHGHLDIMPSFSEIVTMFSNSKFARQDTSIPNFLIPLIQEAIKKTPAYPDLHNSLGTQFMLCGKYERARDAFLQALECHPEYVQARINLFKALYKNKEYSQAYEEGKVLLSQGVQFPDVYYSIAKILMKLGDYAEAMKNAETVLSLGKSMRKTMILIARIQLCQGDKTAAARTLTAYLEGDTSPDGEAEANKILGSLAPKRGDLVMMSVLSTFAGTQMKCG